MCRPWSYPLRENVHFILEMKLLKIYEMNKVRDLEPLLMWNMIEEKKNVWIY